MMHDKENVCHKILDFLDLELKWDELSSQYYMKKKSLGFVYISYSDKCMGEMFFTVKSYDEALTKILDIPTFHQEFVPFDLINIKNPFYHKTIEEVQIMLDLAN